ncbi:MAG TPA: DUF1566 domain-containing protein, partial [Rhodanobacteraceae bacterium]|nr:DUF1566 domain-containing protein [Rhodanobacteraceae bacterium]
VTDTWTGLMWTRATIGRNLTHAQAMEAVKRLDLAGHNNWRLPNDHELLTLVDRNRYDPAIDTDAFPDTANDWYWTITQCAWDASCAWIVNFFSGNAFNFRRDGYACVRAVRSVPAGQSSLSSALPRGAA